MNYSYYKKDCYSDMNKGYDFGQNNFQNSYQSDEWEKSYGWNYYPDMEDGLSYDKKDEYDFRQNYQKEEYKTNNSHNCGCSFKSCFPCFPCFRKKIDCRRNKPCYEFDRCNDWKNSCKSPCHDREENKCDFHKKGNRFYFSGCIEINNFDKKF